MTTPDASAAPLKGRVEMKLIPVEPQPEYIESSGRWLWPLPLKAQFSGCTKEVVTASREWWEYVPSEAKPHPMAEGVRLRDNVWYWAVPLTPDPKLIETRGRLRMMAVGILKVRDAFISGGPEEAYHNLYSLSCPQFDSLNPWEELERLARKEN